MSCALYYYYRYPWVCKYGIFPLDHPEVLKTNFSFTSSSQPYKGLVYCRVTPPRQLEHAVLPWRHPKVKKLLFPLCRSCALLNDQSCDVCPHSDSERSLEGVFTHLELNEALRQRYRLQEIYEVWSFSDWAEYDGEREETGLFTRYMNAFLRLKLSSSGYPANVRTEEERKGFLEQVFREEGVRLRPEEMTKNPANRQIAKLALNSLCK